jgi:hypothetical protein
MVKHFAKEKIRFQRFMGSFQDLRRGTIKYKKFTGRPPKISTPKKLKAIKRMFKKDPNISVQRATDRLRIAKSTQSDIKVHELGIKVYTTKTVSKCNPDQSRRAKANCQKIAENRYSLASQKYQLWTIRHTFSKTQKMCRKDICTPHK